MQDDVVGQQPTVIDAPESSLRRSTREKIPSSCYSANEYVLFTNGDLRVLTRPWKVKKKKDGLMLWEMRLNLYKIIIHYLKTKKLRKIGGSSG